MIVIRGDGRIIKDLDKGGVISALKDAQSEGDRFASVTGWMEAGLNYEDLEREAGYQGATPEECEESLKPYDATLGHK